MDRPIDPSKLKGLLDDEFRAPDIIGTVEGWRAWIVPSELPAFGLPPKLYSATRHYFWAPRQVAEAECHRGIQDHVPDVNCGCGFYSALSLEHLQTMAYYRYDEERTGQWRVVGKVHNWGRVDKGTKGWVAQYSYPAELFVPFEAWRLAKPLSEAYGVPVSLKNILRRS